MNIEDLISQYLDGSLSSEAEADLHHRLAVSPEARQLFRAHIMLRGIARDQRVLHVPTTEARARLFDRLVKEEGMQLPPVAPTPASAAPPAAATEPSRPAPIPSAAVRRTGKTDHRRRRMLPWLIPSLVASMLFVVVLNTSWIDNLSDTSEPEIASNRDTGAGRETAVKPDEPEAGAPHANVPEAAVQNPVTSPAAGSSADASSASVPSVNAPSVSTSSASAPSTSAQASRSREKTNAAGKAAAPSSVDQSSRNPRGASIDASAAQKSLADGARVQSAIGTSQRQGARSSRTEVESFRPRTLSGNIARDADGRANSAGGSISDAALAHSADSEAKQENSGLGEQAMAMSAEGGSDRFDNAADMAADSPDNARLNYDDTPKLARHMVPSDNRIKIENESSNRLMNTQSNSISGPQRSLFGLSEINASAPPPAALSDNAGSMAMESSLYSSISPRGADTVTVQSLSNQLRGSAPLSTASPIVEAEMLAKPEMAASVRAQDSVSLAMEREHSPMTTLALSPNVQMTPSQAPFTAVVGLQQNSLASLERSNTQMQVLIRAGVEFGRGDHQIFGIVSGGHYRENTTDKLIEVLFDGQLFPSEAVAATGESSKTVVTETEQNEVWAGGGYRFSREVAEGWRVGVGVWSGAGNRYVRVATEVPVTYQPVRWIRIEFLPMVQYTAAHGETTSTTVTSFNPELRYSERVERTTVLEFTREFNLGIGIGASVLW